MLLNNFQKSFPQRELSSLRVPAFRRTSVVLQQTCFLRDTCSEDISDILRQNSSNKHLRQNIHRTFRGSNTFARYIESTCSPLPFYMQIFFTHPGQVSRRFSLIHSVSVNCLSVGLDSSVKMMMMMMMDLFSFQQNALGFWSAASPPQQELIDNDCGGNYPIISESSI